MPEGVEDVGGDILGAGHRRRCQNQLFQIRGRWRRNAHFARSRLGIRVGADGGHVQPAEFSPVGKRGGQRDSRFRRSELQETVARAPLEGISQAMCKLGVDGRRVGSLD